MAECGRDGSNVGCDDALAARAEKTVLAREAQGLLAPTRADRAPLERSAAAALRRGAEVTLDRQGDSIHLGFHRGTEPHLLAERDDRPARAAIAAAAPRWRCSPRCHDAPTGGLANPAMSSATVVYVSTRGR
jgi:hypothetical protein